MRKAILIIAIFGLFIMPKLIRNPFTPQHPNQRIVETGRQ